MFTFLFTGLFTLIGSILKGLGFILVTYVSYELILCCVSFVWETIHPKSLYWFKDRFNTKKKKSVK